MAAAVGCRAIYSVQVGQTFLKMRQMIPVEMRLAHITVSSRRTRVHVQTCAAHA